MELGVELGVELEMELEVGLGVELGGGARNRDRRSEFCVMDISCVQASSHRGTFESSPVYQAIKMAGIMVTRAL